MGFIGEDVWYAHDWEVTKEEYKVLAATGTGVSHCPAPVSYTHLDVEFLNPLQFLLAPVQGVKCLPGMFK